VRPVFTPSLTALGACFDHRGVCGATSPQKQTPAKVTRQPRFPSRAQDSEQRPDFIVHLFGPVHGGGDLFAEEFAVALAESLGGLLHGCLAHAEFTPDGGVRKRIGRTDKSKFQALVKRSSAVLLKLPAKLVEYLVE